MHVQWSLTASPVNSLLFRVYVRQQDKSKSMHEYSCVFCVSLRHVQTAMIGRSDCGNPQTRIN